MASSDASSSRLFRWRTHPAAILPPGLIQTLIMAASDLPLLYIFRSIRCEQLIAPLQDTEDRCRSPQVQKAYTVDIAIFTAIITIMGIVVAGPYGTLSDFKGRRRALMFVAFFNTLGCIWLLACTSVQGLRRPWTIQLAAVIQGLGGGYTVPLSAHNAFIADTTSPDKRSWYLGLSSVMLWTGLAIGPLISSPLIEHELYTLIYAAAAVLWIVYLLYIVFFLRETRILPSSTDSRSVSSTQSTDSGGNITKPAGRLLVRVFIEPLRLVISTRAILFPCLAFLGLIIALGSLTLLIQYCDVRFGIRPNEAAAISAVLSIARAVSLIVILPLIIAAFSRFTQRTPQTAHSVPSDLSDERTPLLPEDRQAAEIPPTVDEADPASTSRANEAPVARDLMISRICLIIDAMGMLLIWRGRSVAEVSIATAIGSMGAPASPSLQALITIATPPDEVGRVLAAVTIIESLGVALRTPIFFPLFHATLEKVPGAIYGLSAAILLLSSGLMFFLRPDRPVQH